MSGSINAKAKLSLTTLETREVPAALTSFNANTGALTVTIDNAFNFNGQNAQITGFGGVVQVNGQNALSGGRTIPSPNVKSIVVNGSGFDNFIDLRQVTTQSFRGLDGKITVNAGAGNDMVHGSAFGDNINGGNDNDVLVGNFGNDVIRGGAGSDSISGGSGWNKLYGEGGNDVFHGVNFNDSFNEYYGTHGSNDVITIFSSSRDRVMSGSPRIINRVR